MKKLLYFMVIILIISLSKAGAMYEKRVKEVRFGEGLTCFIEGKSTHFLHDSFIKEKNKKDFNITLPDIKMTIDSGKNLKITGNKRKRDIFVQDLAGDMIAKFSSKKQKKDNEQSLLDEEKSTCGCKLQLLPGSSITVGPHQDELDSTAIAKITFDEAINLISDRKLILPSVLSHWQKSQLVKVATRYPRQSANKRKIFLDDSITDIMFLDGLLRSNNWEEKKKSIMALPIIEHVRLLVLLDKHGLGKKFSLDCNYFDNAKILLEKKINDSLERAEKKNLSGQSIGSELEWFDKLEKLSLRGKEVLEDTLRRIMRSIPKVLHEYYLPYNTLLMACYPDAMKAVISCSDGKSALIDLQSGNFLVYESGIFEIYLNKAGTRAQILCEDYRRIIVNLKSKKKIFDRKNVYYMSLNQDYTKALITYLDGSAKLVNLENKKIIFEENRMDIACFNLLFDKLICYYLDNRTRIIDLKNGEDVFKDKDVQFIQLNKDSSMAIIYYLDGRVRIIDLKNGEDIFRDKNVCFMELDEDCLMAAIFYHDKSGKIVNLKNGKIIFKDKNVQFMQLKNSSIAIIYYHDDRAKIINLETGKEEFNGENIGLLCLVLFGKKILVHYNTGIIALIDFKGQHLGKKIILQRTRVDRVLFTTDFKTVLVYYKDNSRVEIIDIESGRQLFIKNNVSHMYFRENNRIFAVEYENGEGEIRYSPENEKDRGSKLLFEGNNIHCIHLSSDGMKAVIWYKNNKIEVLSLEDYNQDAVFIPLNLKELLSIFTLKKLSCLKQSLHFINVNNVGKYYKLWQFLYQRGKKKLIDSYLSKEVKGLFLKI